MATRVVTLADTHIRRGWKRRLPAAAYAELERADAVVHAGDVLVAEVLDDLARFAPVHAVLGNNDAELVGALPEELEVEIAGVRVAVVHDSGPRAGRERRLRRRFPAARVVVFGHSHVPWDAPGEDGQWLHNPGSATERRTQPHHTLGTLDLDAGCLVSSAIVRVGPDA